MSSQSFADALDAIAAGSSVTHQADKLWSQLTDDEKISLLSGTHSFWTFVWSFISKGYAQEPIYAGRIERLGIPGLNFTDGPRGCLAGPGSVFPVPALRAATFDPALEEAVGLAIGEEVRCLGRNWFAGVCINLTRHPAWGRAQESYGEDPLLCGLFGTALSRGAGKHVMVCVKHFALNSIEDSRFDVNIVVDPATMHEVYLPHFRMVLDDSTCETIMTAYNYVNGEHCSESVELIRNVLQKHWGHDDCLVTSDFVWGTRTAKGSIKNGLDVEMPAQVLRAREVRRLLQAGEVDWEDLRRPGVKVLATQLRYFDRIRDVPIPHTSVLRSNAHRLLAQEVAAAGFVLLENRSSGTRPTPLLPVDRLSVKRVALIGPLHKSRQTGDNGSSAVADPDIVTPFAAFSADANLQILYDDGRNPARAARVAGDADLCIVLVGLSTWDEGESVTAISPDAMVGMPLAMQSGPLNWIFQGVRWLAPPVGDRKTLKMSDHDIRLARAVGEAAGVRSLMCLSGSGPLLIPRRVRRLFGAIMWTGYGGCRFGPALQDVVFGDQEPSGRLPFVIPEDEGDVVAWDPAAEQVVYDRYWGYRRLQKLNRRPAYAFGYGLGYSQIDLLDCQVPAHLSERFFNVHVRVRNNGSRETACAVQVYAGSKGAEMHMGDAADYNRVIIGFQKLQLKPGEVSNVAVACRVDPLARWSEKEKKLELRTGDYVITAARNESDIEAIVQEVACPRPILY